MRPFLENKINAATALLRQEITLVATNAGISFAGDPMGSAAPLPPSVDERISAGLDLLSGVPMFQSVADTRTSMRNEMLRQNMLAMRQDVTSLRDENDAQQALLLALLSGEGLHSTQIASLTARLDLVQAASAMLRTDLTANQSADALVAARLSQVEAQQAADKLADAALALHEQQQDAQLALLAARATADEALIAAAQAKVDAAQATATQAINAAAAAQSKADAATTDAAAAQATATTNAATLSAVQADVATRLPASAVRRFVVSTPAANLLVGTPLAVPVTLPTPFPNDKYLVFFTKASGNTLLNVQVSDTAKTATGFNLTMQTTGLVTLAVLASSVEVFAIQL